MPLPPDVETCTVNVGTPFGLTGRTGFVHVIIRPLFGGTASRLIWTATGDPFESWAENLPSANGGRAPTVSLQIPYSDQPGFRDPAGNTVTMWPYQMTVTTFDPNGVQTGITTKEFTPLSTGPSVLDFDLIISEGEAAPVTGGSPVVLFVNGHSGPSVNLTKADIGLPLANNTPDSAKPVSIAQADADAAVRDFAIQRGNHTGTQSADSLVDGTTNKAFLGTERAKLAGVATGATANSPDAALRDRGTHTGVQPESTVTGLVADLAGKERKLRVNLADYAVGDGVTDDGPNWVAAVAAVAVGGVLTVPQPAVSYRMATGVTIDKRMRIEGVDRPKIQVDVPDASALTSMFTATVSDVTIDGLWFSGAGKTGTPTDNRYIFRAVGTSLSRLKNIRMLNCKMTDLDVGWYSGSKPATTFVVHGMYCDFVDNPRFERNEVDVISGSACFFRRSRHWKMLHNVVNDTGWYSLHADGGNTDLEMAHNTVTAPDGKGPYWGAFLDLMGQNANNYGSDTHGRVHHNYCSGPSLYGNDGAVRCSSSAHIEVDHNTFDQVQNANLVSVTMRQSSGNTNGAAPKHIRIHHNHAVAWGANQSFVLAQNGITGASGGVGPIVAAEGLHIEENTLENVDASNYFACLAQINGQDGGWSNIRIFGNTAKGNPISSGSLQGGLVSVVGRAGTPVYDVQATDNILTFDDMAGGVASSSADAGVFFGAYVSQAKAKNNTLRGFYHGVRCQANSGPDMDPYDNTFVNSVVADVLMDAGVVASTRRIPRVAGITLSKRDSQTGATITGGDGSPEGVVTAVPSSIYFDFATAGGLVYRKATGTGNTGWVLGIGPAGPTGAVGAGFAATFRSGFYSVGGLGSPTTTQPVNGLEVAIPWIPDASGNVDRLSTEITTVGSTGALCRLGLRADSTSNPKHPGALIADFGTVAATSAVPVESATIGSPPAVVAGTQYWLTAVTQGAPSTTPIYRALTGVNPLILGAAARAAGGGLTGYQQSGITGALADWGAAWTAAIAVPWIHARAV